jgi:copper(I)-binding protein
MSIPAVGIPALSLRSIHPLARLASIAVLAALACAPVTGFAHDYALGNLRVDHPYSRPTPPGARTGGAYFTIRNVGADADRLLKVSSPVAQSVELHSMTMEGTLMRMRAVPAIDIPAGGTVTLGTSGYHVMLTGLARPLAVNDEVPLTLTFQKAGMLQVSATVEAPNAGAAAGAAQGQAH